MAPRRADQPPPAPASPSEEERSSSESTVTQEEDEEDLEEKPVEVEPDLEESICVIETAKLFPNAVDEAFLKGLRLIGEKKRAELEKSWTKLRIAEMKLDSERAALFCKQNRLVIDALSRKRSWM